MNKIIWYLHQHAGSPSLGMSYRPYYFSREFNKGNYRSYIIASSFHHLLYEVKNQDETVLHAKHDDVDFLWLKTPTYKANGFNRILNMLMYSYRLVKHHKHMVKLTGKPDIIICSSPPPFHYFAAKYLAKKYKAKLIFEVRDLWPLSLYQVTNMSSLNPLVIASSLIEKDAYRKADAVVSLLENAFDYMEPLGLKRERYAYIPNGIPIEVSTLKAELPQALYEKIETLRQNKDIFLLGYAGAMGIPNALEQLIEAIAHYNKTASKAVALLIVGKGAVKEKLIALSARLNCRNIYFFAPISKEQVNTFLKAMDAAFLGRQNIPVYDYGVSPNKLFDYMLAAKPVLHASSAKADPVTGAQCGITVPAENPQALAEGLKYLAELAPTVLSSMGEQGRAYVEQHHNYDKLHSQYKTVFESEEFS